MCCKIIKNYLLVLSILTGVVSCGTDSSLTEDTGGIIDNVESLNKHLNNVSTNWGCDMSSIYSHMRGYEQVQSGDNNVLIFRTGSSSIFISYRFFDGKLAASTISVKTSSPISDFDFKSYKYIGDLNDQMIYADETKNTIVTLSEPAENTAGFSSIGFAPIVSDLYEKSYPYGVTTDSEISISPAVVTLQGTISGDVNDTKVGFLLGLTPDLTEENSRKVELTTSENHFSATIKSILDVETYYYCAFAILNGITYYGDVLTFNTEPLYYTLNGKQYQMIKVEGGPYGDFSIMQTELTVSDIIAIAGIEATLDCDGTPGDITAYEIRKVVGTLLTATSLPWRMPTSAEWKFAANGGLYGKGYKYSGSDNIDDVVWYKNNATQGKPSGLKIPNELGLYDMCGNYAECINDVQIQDIIDGIYKNTDLNSISKTYSFGGSWKDAASGCTTSSSYMTPGFNTSAGKYKDKWNWIDGSYQCFRLVYSRDPKFSR